jgi:hypothetical protein
MSPSPTPPEATQDLILAPVARWVAATWRDEVAWMRDPLLESSHFDVGDPPRDLFAFEPALTARSRAAISEVFGDIEFVTDLETIRDPDAYEVLGCRPWLGGKSVLTLSRPRIYPRAGGLPRYKVPVDVDHGCQGTLYDLVVAWSDGSYKVTAVVREASWIV